MQNRARARAIAKNAQDDQGGQRFWLWGAALFIGGLAAGAAFADSHENITISHGYTNFGELKYGPNAVLDYVNPDAPKGGEIAVWAQGTFDSFNQYARDGSTASLNTLPYENVLTATADDPYGSY